MVLKLRILIAILLTIVFFALKINYVLAKGVDANYNPQLDYNPVINPLEFSKQINNPFFNSPIGRKIVIESQTFEGIEHNEISISGETKKILGVDTIVYRDIVYLDGVLVEDTMDYLAQDTEGNVWYFGEDVKNYENGKFVNTDGSWISGIDGAKPGIWIKANPVVGDSYRQEYYKGEAEDIRNIVAVDQSVTTKLGTFTGCVKTYDWTPLDVKSQENKYYCPQTGSLVLVENLITNQTEELVNASDIKDINSTEVRPSISPSSKLEVPVSSGDLKDIKFNEEDWKSALELDNNLMLVIGFIGVGFLFGIIAMYIKKRKGNL